MGSDVGIKMWLEASRDQVSDEQQLEQRDDAAEVLLQAEDGIRDLVRSRGLGDVYKRQHQNHQPATTKGDCHVR